MDATYLKVFGTTNLKYSVHPIIILRIESLFLTHIINKPDSIHTLSFHQNLQLYFHTWFKIQASQNHVQLGSTIDFLEKI